MTQREREREREEDNLDDAVSLVLLGVDVGIEVGLARLDRLLDRLDRVAALLVVALHPEPSSVSTLAPTNHCLASAASPSHASARSLPVRNVHLPSPQIPV